MQNYCKPQSTEWHKYIATDVIGNMFFLSIVTSYYQTAFINCSHAPFRGDLSSLHDIACVQNLMPLASAVPETSLQVPTFTSVSAAADRPARCRGSAHAKYSVSHHIVIKPFLLLGLATEYRSR